VGVAGPLAGFIFIVPALIIGLQQSTELVFTEPIRQSLDFGEPLMFQLAAPLFFPGDPDATIRLHPIGWAAWFGMLATSIILFTNRVHPEGGGSVTSLRKKVASVVAASIVDVAMVR